MRIAQVAPLFESVPPKLYGGTERVVSYLTEELVGMGHEVTLFASGDSKTAAALVAPCASALRLGRAKDPVAPHMLMVEEVIKRSASFDVVHFHIDALHFPSARRMGVPHVTTVHGRQDLPELALLYDEFSELPLVSISDAQRKPVPRARFEATVYHGLPAGLLRAGRGSGGYLAFTGRISPEKQPDVAIEIARRAGMPLKIAAKVDKGDRAYFHSVVEPLLEEAGGGVEFIGEISDEQKQGFLGEAAALVFPINWPEPFGLVMIEAMSCGTPTIAFGCGAVPEVLDDGVSGLVVHGVHEAVEAVERARGMDRGAVRARFEARFTARRMAEDYLRVYRRLIGAGSGAEGAAGGGGVLRGRHRPD